MRTTKEAQALAAALAITALSLLGACQTVAGAGKDISTAGDAVSDTAQEVEEDLKED